MQAKGGLNVKRLLIAALNTGAIVVTVLVVSPAGGAANAPSKLTICHKTSSDTNPFVRITVSSSSVNKSSLSATLKRHFGHAGDAIVVGTGACPAPSITPTPSSTPPAKVEICHKTGSSANPYRRITVSSRAVTNPNSQSGKALRGHMRHAGDIIAPGASRCPSTSTTGGGPKVVKLTADLEPVSGATGSGAATVNITAAKSQLCFTLSVSGLGSTITAAHIHRGSTGAIVVPLTAPTTGSSSGCVTVGKALLREIVAMPGAFYVNVHTTDFPNGQVRGDLSK